MNTNLGGKFFILLAAFGAAVTLGATVTHAGFEWVPPSQPAAAPEVTPAAPNVTVAPGIPPAPSSDVVLPPPGEETTPAPVAATPLVPPPPVAAAPAAVMPIPVTPQLRPSDAATASSDVPVNTLLDAPSGYQAQPLLPPEENTAIKVREVTPPPAAPDSTPLSITDSRPTLPEPVTTQQIAPPVAAAAQQPRVFMPEDAPQTAFDNTPNSQKLVINPRPYGDAVPAPSPSFDSVVVSATQTPSDKPVLEGFGSDMPLALALQQIVPADYATSFESGVNVGQIVSWDGGKPWDQVVNEMLAPLQLQAVIINKTVHVRSPGGWRQGDASPAAADKNNLRRVNIKDPGEQSEQQDANALSDIATASGGPEKISPAEDRAASKAEPAAPAETEALPTPEQLNAETPDAAPATTPEAQQDVQQNAQKPALPLLAAATENEKTPANPWEAKAGESLRDILTRWSEQAGVELVWMASYDYKIKQDVALKDDFTGAVESVIATGLDAEASATPELQIMQKPGAQVPGGILIRDKRA
jgi:hypothetical protein